MIRCLFIMIAPLIAQIAQAEQSHPPAPVSPAAAQQADNAVSSVYLAALLQQLGDEQFEKREAAQSRLGAMTDAQIAAAFPQIAAVYRDTPDAEIRMRLNRFGNDCFDRLVLPRYDQLHQSGFLGVTPARAKLGDGATAIVVTSILADSPALKAGLHQGDMITAIDDQPMDDTDPVGGFIKAVQRRHPGMRVQFTLRRGDQTLTIAAQLAILPDQYRDPRIVEFRKEQTEILRQRWLETGLRLGVLQPDLPPPPPAPTDPRQGVLIRE